jgi:hypothetical protein
MCAIKAFQRFARIARYPLLTAGAIRSRSFAAAGLDSVNELMYMPMIQ